MLRELLNNAWNETVEDYKASRINSERTLQAALYSRLRTRLPTSTQVLCEPVISFELRGNLIPDMVIAEGGDVIAIIELKFVPHHRPMWRGDLEKLRWYGEAKEAHFQLVLDPGTGVYTEDRFRFTENCLLVFGVVGRHDAEALDQEILFVDAKGLEDRFVPLLHAVGNP